MSKENKIRRAEEYLAKNREIVRTITKLCDQYSHNSTCACNLYEKAQVDPIHRPSDAQRWSGISWEIYW